MKDPQSVANILQQTFHKIHLESMQDIPILNSRIKVQALGFQEYQGRIIGVIITPWLMNVVLLPTEDEDWSHLALGHKQSHQFPSKSYRFMVNEIEGIGFCQTHSLYSPMNEFNCHEQAVKVAEAFIAGLLLETEPTEDDRVDEELLGRIMRGEEIPDLDNFATIEPQISTIPVKNITDTKAPEKTSFNRRALLRGSFMEDS